MCVGGGSKAKALQACLNSIVAARWNGASRQEVSDQKKIVYLRKQVGLNIIKGKTCVSFRPEYGHNGSA